MSYGSVVRCISVELRMLGVGGRCLSICRNTKSFDLFTSCTSALGNLGWALFTKLPRQQAAPCAKICARRSARLTPAIDLIHLQITCACHLFVI